MAESDIELVKRLLAEGAKEFPHQWDGMARCKLCKVQSYPRACISSTCLPLLRLALDQTLDAKRYLEDDYKAALELMQAMPVLSVRAFQTVAGYIADLQETYTLAVKERDKTCREAQKAERKRCLAHLDDCQLTIEQKREKDDDNFANGAAAIVIMLTVAIEGGNPPENLRSRSKQEVEG